VKVSTIDDAGQDKVAGDVLESFVATKAKVSAVDKSEGSRLNVEVDDGLFKFSVAQKLASAKGYLNKLISVELCQLGGLLERCDEECAVLNFFSCVDDFLQVEATSVLLEDTLEDNVVCLSSLLLLVLALLNFLPDFVRLL